MANLFYILVYHSSVSGSELFNCVPAGTLLCSLFKSLNIHTRLYLVGMGHDFRLFEYSV